MWRGVREVCMREMRLCLRGACSHNGIAAIRYVRLYGCTFLHARCGRGDVAAEAAASAAARICGLEYVNRLGVLSFRRCEDALRVWIPCPTRPRKFWSAYFTWIETPSLSATQRARWREGVEACISCIASSYQVQRLMGRVLDARTLEVERYVYWPACLPLQVHEHE